ncbi:uncharacterized protein Dvir_GJ19234 [Drosophila virilis]|uniref:Uncharacterized protein n=2 Tax=Drosophila virilis TaxID=7244 RepID=B4M3M0_DROVI|nr:uncharacterized protein Dvir_GJ19234 [Drosophila virilis]
MLKLTTCWLLLVVLLASAEANTGASTVCVGRCHILDLHDKRRVCTRDAKTNMCTKMLPCRLRERNCALRSLGLPPLRETSLGQCANVVSSTGTARCVLIPRPTKPRPNVNIKVHVSCIDKACNRQTPNSCWRTRDGRNLWLSLCDARERNCINWNNPQLQLVRIHDVQCRSKAPVIKG